MAKPDRIVKQTYDWYSKAIDRALTASGLAPAERAAVQQLLWRTLGVKNPAAPPNDPDLADFNDTGADAQSIALAAQVTAESLAALDYLRQAVQALQPGGNPAGILALVAPVMDQIDRLHHMQAGSRYPSALSLGKALLTLSGDADANPASGSEAAKLAATVGAAGGAGIDNAQTALALITLFIGSVIDRAFTPPATAPGTGWVQQPPPDLAAQPKLVLSGPAGIGGTLEFATAPPTGVKAALNLALNSSRSVDGNLFNVALTGTSGISAFLPLDSPQAVRVSGDLDLQLSMSRSNDAGTLVIGSDALGARVAIGELGVTLRLKNGEPRVGFFARKAKATLTPPDAFLKLVLGNAITLDLSVEAEADRSGALRLTNGTGLRASLPVPTLPTGPFELQLINFGLDPVGGSFQHLQVELSASFGVTLGPFAASVDRMGVLLDARCGQRRRGRSASHSSRPNGIGLVARCGHRQGRRLPVGLAANGYAGVLELKMLAVDVKAIAVLNTQSEAGFSLLLLIFGQFPAIQLSFGFTLTGIGGLIGVQHTASPTALSQGISTGALDAVLFPENPVANAPQIINTLRTLFPVKAAVSSSDRCSSSAGARRASSRCASASWSKPTSSRCWARRSCRLPPLVSADLALLYLRLDFVGCGRVRSAAYRVRREAASIRASRSSRSPASSRSARSSATSRRSSSAPAASIRASRRFRPTFRSPFDRVGASFDIGIVGISFKGYFAITSATMQAGCSTARVGRHRHRRASRAASASTRSAISCRSSTSSSTCTPISPCTCSASTSRRYISTALLAGPGRWHIAGNARGAHAVAAARLLAHVDEHGARTAIRRRSRSTSPSELSEGNRKGGELVAHSCRKAVKASSRLRTIEAGGDVLAHPLGSARLPAEARAARIAPGEGERQQDRAARTSSRRRRCKYRRAPMLAPEAKPVAATQRLLRGSAVSRDVAGRHACRSRRSSCSRRATS